MPLYYSVTFQSETKQDLELNVRFEAASLVDLLQQASDYIRTNHQAVLLTMELVDAIPTFDQAA